MEQYEFDTVYNTAVKITPMNLLFSKEVMDELRRFGIKEGRCFENSVLITQFLEKKGYEVNVVEGYIRINKKAKKMHSFDCYDWIEHRWCKYKDYYFDPTLFLATKGIPSSYYDYKAERLYYSDDLIAFAKKVSEDYNASSPGYNDLLWCSSLNGAIYLNDGNNTIKHLAKIDKDFNYVKIGDAY